MKKTDLLSKTGLIIISLILINQVQSQIGVGTKTPRALIHIETSAKEEYNGIIFPKLNSLPEIKIEEQNLRKGQLIYHQDEQNNINNGFYYYYGTGWKSLDTKADNGLNINTTNGKVELGGKLFKNTEIDTNQSNLNIIGDGNISIGHNDPKAKLDLKGTFKYEDGNQGTGKVLMSDEFGNAKWTNYSGTLPIIVANYSITKGQGITIDVARDCNQKYDPVTSPYRSTGATITIPPESEYLISVTQLIKFNSDIQNGISSGEGVYLKSTFSEISINDEYIPSDDITTNPKVISGGAIGPFIENPLHGNIIIHNTTKQPKTYFYVVGKCYGFPSTEHSILKVQNFGSNIWEENAIVGIPVNHNN